MEAENMETKNRKKVRTVPVAGPASQGGSIGRSMANRAGGVVQKVTNYIEENPFTAVTLALGVGILATALLRASGVNLARLLSPPPSPPEDDLTD